MDGKPLYEYARESKPLPRAIPVRECTVSIDLIDFQPASVEPGDSGHSYTWPKERLSSEEKAVFRRLTEMVHQASENEHNDKADPAVPDLESADVPEVSATTGLRPAAFKVRMTVSSGTYVRSIVHDIGLALGCGAHVVTLTRTRQGEFSLHGDEETLDEAVDEKHEAGAANGTPNGGPKQAPDEMTEEEAAMMGVDFTPPVSMTFAAATGTEADAGPSRAGPSGGCIPWPVFERALAERDALLSSERKEKEEARASGMDAEEYHQVYSDEAVMQRRRDRETLEWEQEVLKRFVSVPVPIGGSHGTARFR